MSDPSSIPSYAYAYQDRRAQLMFCGVVEILMGLLSAGFTLLMVVSVAMASAMQGSAGTQLDPITLVPGLLVYGGAAVFFIWMGVGTIRLRRWARALMLVVSSLWLAVGVLGLAGMAWFIPTMRRMMDEPAGSMRGGEAIIAVVLCVMGGIYVLLPGMLLLLYRGDDVLRTVEAADPYPAWTDRVPLPVLALCVILAYLSATCLLLLITPSIPFFGRYLTGLPAAALGLALAGILAWLTREAYRLRPAGLWGALAVIALGGVSYALTFNRGAMTSLYTQMGYGQDQIALLNRVVPMDALMWMTLLLTAVVLAWVVSLRRHFRPAVPEGSL